MDLGIQGVAKSALYVEVEEELGVLVVDTVVHNKKKDVILEFLVRVQDGKIEILKQHREVSNKVYAW